MKTPSIHRRDFLHASLGLSLAAATTRLAQAAEPDTQGGSILGKEPGHPAGPASRSRYSQAKPKDLEHGLELHADSLVFETYGFAPRAAVDGDAIRQAAEAGASAIELKDMREDMSMTRYATDPVERVEFMEAWEASGVTCIFQNAGEEGQDPMRYTSRFRASSACFSMNSRRGSTLSPIRTRNRSSAAPRRLPW
jgi:membrane dipeptidase